LLRFWFGLAEEDAMRSSKLHQVAGLIKAAEPGQPPALARARQPPTVRRLSATRVTSNQVRNSASAKHTTVGVTKIRRRSKTDRWLMAAACNAVAAFGGSPADRAVWNDRRREVDIGHLARRNCLMIGKIFMSLSSRHPPRRSACWSGVDLIFDEEHALSPD
jgi:hypothetical protein